MASAAATHALTWRVATLAAGTPDRYVNRDTDALSIPWPNERVFCNPPYGRGLGDWARKALLEASENNALVVLLIPARTDTSWFHEVILPHAEIRFIRGRLSYTLRGGVAARTGRAPFASMVAVFRPNTKRQGTGRAQLLMPFLPKRPS